MSVLEDDTDIALLARDELEDLVRARTREIENVIDAMAEVLIKLDAEARIELVNETALSKLGYDANAIEGKPIESLLASLDRCARQRGCVQQNASVSRNRGRCFRNYNLSRGW